MDDDSATTPEQGRQQPLHHEHYHEPKQDIQGPIHEKKEEIQKKPLKSTIIDFYDKQYKLLLFIPIILLVLALFQIGYQYHYTGDFMAKGVSLKGGVTLTIPLKNVVDVTQLEKDLDSAFPNNDLNVRSLEQAGTFIGLVIEADIDGTNEQAFSSFLGTVRTMIPEDFGDDYGVEIIGSSLGASFFREAFYTFLIAFLFMGIVVFVTFRTFVPSMAVILAAFSDIVMTLAVVNVLGVKISTAGIAAFIMLIGYSIDTDILLSTRVLKRKEGTIFDRILGSVKTGLTMTLTTLIAVLFGYFFSQSETLSQIMLIIIIGLIFDMINTWLQNTAILRIYLAKKKPGTS